jgi:hypothetical protein
VPDPAIVTSFHFEMHFSTSPQQELPLVAMLPQEKKISKLKSFSLLSGDRNKVKSNS